MARLASTAKAGFYPLPPAVTERLCTLITAPQGGRILDPCAGEGVALCHMAKAWRLAAYGAELHRERAARASVQVAKLAARSNLPLSDEVSRPLVTGDYRLLSMPHGGVNLLYLNPPYDYDSEAGRLEYQFLRDCRPWLQPDGLLLFVIPQSTLAFRRLATYLASWFNRLHIWRFPDGEYERFRQVVLLGYRLSRARAADPSTVAWIRESAAAGRALPTLDDAPLGSFTLPAPTLPTAHFSFRSRYVDPQEAYREATTIGVRQSGAWQKLLRPQADLRLPVRPIMPLKIGHLAGLMAAGFLDHQLLEDAERGERLLIKGRAYKQTVHATEQQQLADGSLQQLNTATDRLVTDVTTISPDGAISSLQGAELEAFMRQWLPHFTAQIATRYPPEYQFDYTDGPYAATLNRLSLTRKVPRLNRYGLLPAQKHAAAALATRLTKAPDAILVGQMGTGKAQSLDAKVLTPKGWKQMGEIQVGAEVIDPKGGTARVIGVFPQGEKDVFRVTFSDGSSTECCDEHLWQVHTTYRKWAEQPAQVLELQQIRERLRDGAGNPRYFIPMVEPVQFEAQPLPLDPYLLGVLLGDGGFSDCSAMVTTADEELRDAVAALLPNEITLTPQDRYSYRLSGTRGSTNPVITILRELGLFRHRAETKFIPDCYRFASVPDRIALLQELMDTGGSVTLSGRRGQRKTSSLEFSTVSTRFAADVTELVQSLGGIATVHQRVPTYSYNGEQREGQVSYRLHIKLPNHICPFRLTRKRERVVPRTKHVDVTRAITRVEYVGRKQTQCIALDSDNQLYVTDDYIVTHNTTCATAVAACLGAGRSLVLCPPHLTKKWKREAEIVWPEVDVQILTTISEVDQFFTQDGGRPRLAVLSHSKAKLASGWAHALYQWRPSKATMLAYLPPPADREAGAWWRERVQPRLRKYQQYRGVRCPDCGAWLANHDGLPLSWQQIQKRRAPLSCTDCGRRLFQFDRRRTKSQQAGSFREFTRREALIRARLAADQPLPDFAPPAGYARWPLATYIRQRYAGQLDLLIADEVHQFKGSDSDQGYAFHDLAVASRKVLGLTGTIFGGKASSLFHLLYRLSPELCRAFTDHEASGKRRIRWRDWLERYGVLQEVETVKLDESGQLTANSRARVRTRELPGASPAMLPWLLDRAVFLNLRDLGFALPGYEEIPITVPMSPAQAAGYESLYRQLKSELNERLVRNDKSLLGAYLQSLLSWVDAPWRDEVIYDPHTKGREDEGILPQQIARVNGLSRDAPFPKEQAILALILQERAAGRRSVLYCQQTGKRDITGHWAALLEGRGLRCAVLKVAPDQREAWIKKQVAAGVDVIITHPRRVETGLDLLDFPSLIWMGTEYSNYTVMQASARSWRIGQTEDVKVYFFVYEDTLQEQALGLIASKVAATVRVGGDVVADDSLAELDEIANGDMVTALARLVTTEARSGPSLADAFADANAEIRAAERLIGDYHVEPLPAADAPPTDEGQEETLSLVPRPAPTLPRPTVPRPPVQLELIAVGQSLRKRATSLPSLWERLAAEELAASGE